MKTTARILTTFLTLVFFYPILVHKALSQNSDFDWEAEIEKIPQGVTSDTSSEDSSDSDQSISDLMFEAEEEAEEIELPSLPYAIQEAVDYYYVMNPSCLTERYEFFDFNSIRYYIPSDIPDCDERTLPPHITERGTYCSTSWGIYGTDRVCFWNLRGLTAARQGRDWNSPLHPSEYWSVEEE